LQAVFARSLPVLMYHHIGPLKPGTYAELTVSPARFAQQLQWLQRFGYTTISAAQWQEWRTGNGTLPAKPVILTFDDAYAETAEYAFPLLERFGFRGTTFVVTDEIGGTNSWDERIGSATHQLMSAEAIRHWAARGFEFGAHCLSHPSLPACNDDEARRQIALGKPVLAALTGQDVSIFAYPYGDFDDRIVALVRAEFPLAVTTEAGINFLATDPCRLQRCMVMPTDGGIDLYGYLRFGFSPRHLLQEKLVSLKHRLLRMAHR
jgi:peptidoglycan/xylan/chitin deacetylase (PgdA/CDA1 family)